MVKLICQAVISLAGLAVGGYMVACVPELKVEGAGIIGIVLGYWLR